jgi:protein MpaA
VLLTLLSASAAVPSAAAKGLEMGARNGVTVAGSPYRYVTVTTHTTPKLTVVARTDRRNGRVDRWWQIGGDYDVPAVDYNGTGGGLSADGKTLVLSHFAFDSPDYPPKTTRLAVLDTDLRPQRHLRAGQQRPPSVFRSIELRGHYAFDAISPDGSTIYLIHHFPNLSGPSYLTHYEVRAYDVKSRRLLPEPIVDPEEPQERMEGLPLYRAMSPDGRWAYTLYDGNGKEPFIHALDTVAGRAVCIDLPQLAKLPRRFHYLLELQTSEGGRRLVVLRHRPGPKPTRALLTVDTRSFAVKRPAPAATASSGTGSRPPIAAGLLAFTRTPRRPGNLLERVGVVGRSAAGRPIGLRQLGDPSIAGKVLVVGCIHGDECAGSTILPTSNGCPDPHSNVFVAANLNPDGAAIGTRLNGRGVDLNRNFPSQWRPIGARGDPQYSGPRPFSEPETRLAARLIRGIAPKVTIWFHQHHGARPLVRAWGASAPAARRLAELAKIPFRRLPWPAGTAPNWQNHRFPDSSSFVVELPPGSLSPDLHSRLNDAIIRIARRQARVGED